MVFETEAPGILGQRIAQLGIQCVEPLWAVHPHDQDLSVFLGFDDGLLLGDGLVQVALHHRDRDKAFLSLQPVGMPGFLRFRNPRERRTTFRQPQPHIPIFRRAQRLMPGTCRLRTPATSKPWPPARPGFPART